MLKDWRLWSTTAAAPTWSGLPPRAAIGVVRRRMAELRQHIAHARAVEPRIEAVTREVEDMILAIVAEDGRSPPAPAPVATSDTRAVQTAQVRAVAFSTAPSHFD